jgi:hypothetical protein
MKVCQSGRIKMKTNNSFITVMSIFILFLSTTLLSQSDYKIVKDFESKVDGIEQSIRNADSISVLNQVSLQIENLNNDYASHKELLDDALFPESLNSTIESLKNSMELRKKDFAQIETLHNAVANLNTQLDTLDKRNRELESKFALLETQNKESIAKMEKMVSQLRIDLQRRDQIVMNMVDNLMPSTTKEGGELNSIEKQNLMSKAEKENILAHIKRAINDNIRFLEATQLYPVDLSKIKAQYEKFVQIWKNVGPELSTLYAEKGKEPTSLSEINQDFSEWNNKINEEAWSSINSEFAAHQIKLAPFTNGNEFTASVTSYAEDAINNSDKSAKTTNENIYKNFVDSTWNASIKFDWIPYLIDNKVLTKDQSDQMDVKIAAWNKVIFPVGFNWFYVIIAILTVAVVVLIFGIVKSRKAVNNYRVQQQHQ